MEVWKDDGSRQFPSDSGTALTVGTFDGVHRGHVHILEELVRVSREGGLRSVVVTFDPHPRHVLQPAVEFGLLTGEAAKTRLIGALGVDYLAVTRFDLALSQLPPERFVVDHLLERFRMRTLVVGYDHAFGKDRAGGQQMLSEMSDRLGFSLVRVPPVLHEGRPISSSRVRRALEEGRMAEAEHLLGRFYSFSGRVVHGAGRGRKLGHPTANLVPLFERKQLFPSGVYAARVSLDGRWVQGALYWGPRPTFNEDEPGLELNLYEFEADLYDRVLEVEVVERIRPIRSFPDSDELIRQMDRDDTAVRRVLEGI
ncbi:riboflavin biosynthesis protein RibF [bacterium]|nr:riboflavin biosynthesis protein RibF [bacterium]